MKKNSLCSQRGSATLHPIMWIAAIALTALSVVGIAKLMGWIGNPAPADEAAALAAAEAPSGKSQEATKAPAAKTPAKKAPARAGGGSDYAQGGGSDTKRVVDPACADCGVITQIRTVEVPAEGSGVGAVAGGVLGGVVGNQFGKGSGKTAATVAGAVLGGVAGHKVEERVRSKTIYEVSVRMEDGSTRVLKMGQAPIFGEGQRVKVSGDQLQEAPAAGSTQRL